MCLKVVQKCLYAVLLEIMECQLAQLHSQSALRRFAWNTVVQALLAFSQDFVKITAEKKKKILTDSPHISAEVFKFSVKEGLKKLLI